MITVLLDILFALCLLPWLVCITALVLLAFFIAAEAGRMLIQALYNIGYRSCARVWRSDNQFLRDLGIKY